MLDAAAGGEGRNLALGQIPSIVIDGDSAIASALATVLPRTHVLEDFRHFKDNVLDAIGGQERHRTFQRFVQPLVDARTLAEFEEREALLVQQMPPALRNYMRANEGVAQRSPLQRLKSKNFGTRDRT